MPDTHPMIALFESHAQALDATGRKTCLDDAITLLAGWMSLAQDHLSENDMAVLGEVGAIMYRDGLNRRIGGQGKENPP